MKSKTIFSINFLWAFLLFSSIGLYADPRMVLRPVPWVTSEAVNFLETFMSEHPNASVLEFGSGSSTIWFAKRTENLVSLEHNPKWHQIVHGLLDSNPECNLVNLILHPQPYYTECQNFSDESFDLILVDGRNRKGCIVHSIPLLKRGGVLMLDNAERIYYHEALKLLKTWKSVKAVQKGLDSCGFTYPDWQTDWYIKP